MASAPGRSRAEGAGLQSRADAARASPAASELRTGRWEGEGSGSTWSAQCQLKGCLWSPGHHCPSGSPAGPAAAVSKEGVCAKGPWFRCGGWRSRPARRQDDLGPHLRPHREG